MIPDPWVRIARRSVAVPRRLLRSPTIQLSVLYAATGVAFTLANLILARVLSIAEYAAVTLVLALVGFGGLLGPLGQERVVVRQSLAVTTGLLAWGAAASATVGLGIAIVSGWIYGVDGTTSVLLFLGSTAYGMAILAAAKFQSEQRFILATVISQGWNPVLLVATLLLAGTGFATASLVTTVFVAALGAIAAASWCCLLAEAAPAPGYRLDWSETLALTGLSGMAAFSATSERLIIPLALSESALADFAVLAALIIAPMRMLQMSAQRTLTPRLRDAASASVRRRLLCQEGSLVAGLVLALSLALWYLAPYAVSMLFGGKYNLTPPLILAALVSGAVRVLNSFSMAAVTALTSRERLHLVNCSGWLTILLAVPAARIGTVWGLAGLVFGISVAWLCQAVVLFLHVLPHFRGD